jgi:pilus assembly protein Flp/PilA
MYNTVQKLAVDKAGVTLIEYGLIAMLIGLAVLTVLGNIGTNLSSIFNTVSTKI